MIQHQVGNSQGNYHYNAYIYTDTFWDHHFHGSYELIYVFEGTAELCINGKADTLQAGEMILLSPYTVHSLKVECGKTWVGVFSEDFIISFAKEYPYSCFSKFRCRPDTEQFLQEHLFVEEKLAHFLLISCLYAMCNECLQHAAISTDTKDNRFISEVIVYIDTHLNMDITLQDVADAMNYEYHYFSALFHQYFSMHFRSFINFFRYEKACSLLNNEANSISSVAIDCGFGSLRNFNRVFKKLSGCTPKEYQSNRCQRTNASPK